MSNRIISLVLGAAFALSPVMPASALPVMPQAPAVQQSQLSDVVQVRDHRRRDNRRGFYRHRDNGYYNGHRGYRHHRNGYRRHNGYWFPPAAFALGAIIGGSVVRQPRRVSNAHVRWCYNHYRSYRQWDNTFQPYNGPRRACRSPYGY